MLYLRPAARNDGEEFYDMLQHIGREENGFLNNAYGIPYDEFPAYLARKVDMAQGIGLEDWMVPASTYWLMDGNVPVGQGNLRHRLTEKLRDAGGHIGYAVASDQRGKGYGRELLRLLLEEARRMRITEDILVTIYPGNAPSRRVAEANGGELRRETEERVYYWFPDRPETLEVSPSIRLRRFHGLTEAAARALAWYQDADTVLLVDGVDAPYTPGKLEGMYTYLDNHGELYWIEVLEDGAWLPIGDVSFWPEDIPIVIGDKRWRGRGVGKAVVERLIARARELGWEQVKVGEIFDFNQGSQALFQSLGFQVSGVTDKGHSYALKL